MDTVKDLISNAIEILENDPDGEEMVVSGNEMAISLLKQALVLLG